MAPAWATASRTAGGRNERNGSVWKQKEAHPPSLQSEDPAWCRVHKRRPAGSSSAMPCRPCRVCLQREARHWRLAPPSLLCSVFLSQDLDLGCRAALAPFLQESRPGPAESVQRRDRGEAGPILPAPFSASLAEIRVFVEPLLLGCTRRCVHNVELKQSPHGSHLLCSRHCPCWKGSPERGS